MAVGDVIVGIDVEASRVSCCLGQINKFNQVEVIDSAISECDGFNQDKYESTDAIARAIRFAIGDIEQAHNFIIKSAYINIIGKFVNIYNTRYGVELEDKYAGVSQKNIDDIIIGVSEIKFPENDQIIDIIPTRFITDTKVTDDPIGIFTKTLSADLDIITADKSVVKQISSIMQKVGLEIDGIILDGFAMRNLVIDEDEERSGVLLLDVGKNNIDISVFKNNSILYTDSLPIGGNTITEDISTAFSISTDEAEKLKKQYGLADSEYIDHDYNIKLTTYSGEDDYLETIQCSDLVSIIEARMVEIFGIIRKSIKANELYDDVRLCVITGQGFSNINKVDVLANKQLNIDVRFGNAKVANLVKQDCIKSFGLVKYVANAVHKKNIGSSIEVEEEQSFFKTARKGFKRAFKHAFKK